MSMAIESVAAWIAEGGLPDETEEEAMADLHRINNTDGWIVEESAPLGHIVRHEGVRLSDADLRAAYILSESWMGDNRGMFDMMTVSEAQMRAASTEAIHA